MPAGIGTAGAALWRRMTTLCLGGAVIVYSAAELVTLEQACKTADLIADLERLLSENGLSVMGSKGQVRLSPVPGELRLQRAALTRLVAQLAIPEDEGEPGLSPASRRAQRAAAARWAHQAHGREARKHG